MQKTMRSVQQSGGLPSSCGKLEPREKGRVQGAENFQSMQHIKGFQRLSLIDFPGQLAAVVFLGGCNLRCGYCHNPSLVLKPQSEPPIKEEAIFSFLQTRKGKLDGVVVTGGEPCLHPGLPSFLKRIKELGFLVKLDTNGTRPDILKQCIPIVDYIAMDIKASIPNYPRVVGESVDLKAIAQSVSAIQSAGIPYEFRTTVHKAYFDKEELAAICAWLKGSKKYVLQQFKKEGPILNEALKRTAPYTKEDMALFHALALPYFEIVELRNL